MEMSAQKSRTAKDSPFSAKHISRTGAILADMNEYVPGVSGVSGVSEVQMSVPNYHRAARRVKAEEREGHTALYLALRDYPYLDRIDYHEVIDHVTAEEFGVLLQRRLSVNLVEEFFRHARPEYVRIFMKHRYDTKELLQHVTRAPLSNIKAIIESIRTLFGDEYLLSVVGDMLRARYDVIDRVTMYLTGLLFDQYELAEKVSAELKDAGLNSVAEYVGSKFKLNN